MQKMQYDKHEPMKKRYKQLVILQKYMHIQRQIQESSARLFQKYHGRSQKNRSLNPSNRLSRVTSQQKIHTQTNDSECVHLASGESTLRHVNTNPAVLNSVREILKARDQSCKKLPSYLSNSYQMMTDQKQANVQQNQFKERKKKARHTYNVFSKYNSSFQRPFRLSSLKGHQQLKTTTLKETTIRVKISMLKKDKWNIISKKPVDSTDILLIKTPLVTLNKDQMKQPVKLKRNYSNMYQIYSLNQQRKKMQNGNIEDIQDDELSTGRIEPWSDQNS